MSGRRVISGKARCIPLVAPGVDLAGDGQGCETCVVGDELGDICGMGEYLAQLEPGCVGVWMDKRGVGVVYCA